MAIELPYQVVDVQEPQIVVHSFGTRDAKTEQRFYMGPGARRLRVNLSALNATRRAALIAEFEAAKGSYAPFNVTYRGATLSVYFAASRLDLQADGGGNNWSSSFELLVAPPSPPSYTSAFVPQTRFPDSGLKTALLDPIQEMIPLLTITPRGIDPHYFSDRAVTVDDDPDHISISSRHQYLARLVSWDGIQQSLNSADQARFTLGNADRAISGYVNTQDWYGADVQFALFHVGTLIKLNLWRGHIIPGGWEFDSGPDFRITAADGAYELRLAYPPSKITRQEFIVPDNSPPFQNDPVWVGKGRTISATSVISDTGWGNPLQDIWVDDTSQPLKVKCTVISGRDESDFFAAVGIVGRGPIGEFGQIPLVVGGTTYHWGTLDGQPNHGPGLYGVRRSLGGDPTTGSETQINNNPDAYSDKIGIDRDSGASDHHYIVTESNPIPPGAALLQIRRTDTKGIQPENASKPHEMVAFVSEGNGGYVWSAGGATRTWTQPLTNPVWIAINVWLRGNGVGAASKTTQESYFLVADAIAAAAVCDTVATKIVGTGTEKQFTWTGVIGEQKPLRDWLKEILASCLGYYTFAFGKLKIGLRWHSGTAESFGVGNLLFNSLQLSSASADYNHLIATFADREYGYVANTMEFKQDDHIAAVGMDLTSNINFSGVSTKSQSGRLVTTLVREQLGGYSADEWKNARRGSFDTTVLALNVDCGTICSLVHEDLPTYSGGTANYGEFIVEGWKLAKDYSITIDWRTTTDHMYDMTVGDKPVDVPVNITPGDIDKNPGVFTFTPALYEYGTVSIENCAVSAGANRGLQSILCFYVFVDELTADMFVTLDDALDDSTTPTVAVTANPDQVTPGVELHFDAGDYILFGDTGHFEICILTSISGGDWTLQRNWPGDAVENALFGSNRHSHAAGTKIYKCQIQKVTFDAATGDYDDITDTSAIPGRFNFALPSACVVAVVATVKNGHGTSAFTVYNCALATVPGLRTLQGGTYTYQRSGDLEVINQAAISFLVQYKSSIRAIFAYVGTAPTGASALLQPERQLGGTGDWYALAGLEIAATKTKSWDEAYPPDARRIPYDGIWPTAILYPGDMLNCSIVQIGSTVAGADLTVMVYT